MAGAIRSFMIAAGACLLATGTAAAESAPPPLYVAAATTPANQLPAQTTASSSWSTRIRFTNRAKTVLHVRAQPFIAGPAGSVTGAQFGAALLKIGHDLPVDLHAHLPVPGPYVVFLRLTDENGTEVATAGLTVTRASDALPADGLFATSQETRLVNGTGDVALRIALTGIDKPVAFRISNPTVSQVATGGDVSTGKIPRVTSVDCSKGAKTIALIANGACSLDFKVADLGAGDYHARFDLIGTGGGKRSVDVPFKVRASFWRMVIWLAVGAILGGFVSWWRDHARGKAAETLAIAYLEEDLETIGASLPATIASSSLDSLRQHLARLRKLIYRGDDLATITAARTADATRIEGIRTALARYDTITTPAQAQTDALQAAIVAIADGDVTAVPAALASLETALFPPTARLAAGANKKPASRPRKIKFNIAWHDFIATNILFFLFAILSLLSVWWTDLDWGNWGDQASAILLGAAGFGGLATSIGTFKTAVTSSRS